MTAEAGMGNNIVRNHVNIPAVSLGFPAGDWQVAADGFTL